MTYIPEPIPIPEDAEDKEFHFLNQLRGVTSVARNLTFTNGAIANNDKAGNMRAVWCVYTSNGTANTEDAVPHTLGYVPVGFFAAAPNKAATIYVGPTAWTKTHIYLKTSVATVIWQLMVF